MRPPSVIISPRREHSRKPDEAYALIERMYPKLPKIELFARDAREGWAAWGNQAPEHDDGLDIPDYLRHSEGRGRVMTTRQRLPNRRASTTFEFEIAGLRYTSTFSRFPDGRIQHGADPEVIRRLCRDSQGNASGPLGRRTRPHRGRR